MKVDVSRFDRALKEYIATTSRDMVTALNGKAKDLALRAAQHTPKTKMTHARFKAQQADEELITYRAKLIFDKRGGPKGNRVFSEIRRKTAETMAKKRFAKGYMRFGYVKAANQFRNTKDASKAPKQTLESRLNGTKAEVINASGKSFLAAFKSSWLGKSPGDAGEKQAIVSDALPKAVAYVTKDMEDYLARKMGATAKKVSA